MRSRKDLIRIFVILAIVWGIFWIPALIKIGNVSEGLAYSQFLNLLGQHQVQEVQIQGDELTGTLKTKDKNGEAKRFYAYKPDDPGLTDRLRGAGVKFSAQPQDNFLKDILSWLIPALFIFGLLGLLGSFASSRGGGGGMLSLGKAKARIYVEKGLKIRFEDVAGVAEAKEELKEIVDFLKDPARFTKLGGRMPKGVLLVGPPGTGKTLLARAVAGEAGVPFFSINGSEFVELFVGLGAARVRDLFQQARSQAPCIIFIDELDALGRARGLNAITGSSNDEKEQTLNQLLAELDGFDPSTGVVLVAATNRPEVLDPALLRAGRFDRQVLVDKPDRAGRAKILEVHMRKIKLSPQIHTDVLASMTAGFSGADLANLVNEAALLATRRQAEAVEMRDFTEAMERIVAGLERKNRLLNSDEKRRVAHHEMGHTVLALALGKSEVIHKVSIIPRGIGALGYTFRRPTEDRYLMSYGELEDKMAIALGGRAAELIYFGDTSTGAADDLDKATEIARAMVTRYGMSRVLGLATFEKEPSPVLGPQSPVQSHEYSEETSRKIDEEVKRLLDRAFERAVDTLKEHRGVLDRGVGLLLERETLDESQLDEIWCGGRPSRAAA
jgi:cell division protease FtsH